MMAKCKSCGAEIDFIKTKQGKFLPVNLPSITVKPDPLGNIMAVLEDGTVTKATQVGDAYEGYQEQGYIAHWATCPAAKEYRRTK